MNDSTMKHAICLLAVSAAVSIAQAAPPRYKMELLPVPTGCQSFSQLHGLGEQGQVVGEMTCDEFATQRAVTWNHGVLLELGTFGGPNSYPFGISQRGEVVGTAETSEAYEGEYHVTRPFLWVKGTMQDLGTLGGPLGGAAAINASGTIVGACQPEDEDSRIGRLPSRACVWQDGKVKDLGDLGGPEATAYDVNNRGWIAGDSNTADLFESGLGYVDHAFLHDGKAMYDLGTLGGPASIAFSLNERGEVVGYSYTGVQAPSGQLALHAFLWREGRMFDLGPADGASAAWDINNQGQIVGWSWSPAPAVGFGRKAVLWENETITNLNELIVDADGWWLSEAWAIDERGRILANAFREGRWRLAILTPVPSD